jgi:DNA primase
MINTDDIRRSVDLLSLVGNRLKRVATTHGGEYAGPCPFCGGKDRFHVQPNAPGGGRWFCRTCTGEPGEGGHWEDAIAFVMRRDNVGFRTACETLGADITKSDRKPKKVRSHQPAPAPDPGPPPREWQKDAWEIVTQSKAVLWSKDGAKARAWLEQRGLQGETLSAYHIGYCPKDGTYHGLYVPRGIVIPWIVGDNIWKVQVRRPEGDPKYMAVKGSRNPSVLFGTELLSLHPDCFVVEGEFDAMLLWQEIGGVADVLTLGSASGNVADRWLRLLLSFKRFWVATDNDAAGERAAEVWLKLTGERGCRIFPPGDAKDVTEAWQKGEDLKGWALSHLPKPEPSPVLDLPALYREVPIKLNDLIDVLDRHQLDGRVLVTPNGLSLNYWPVDS